MWSDRELGGISYHPVRPGYCSTIIKWQGAELEHATIFLDVAGVPGAAYTAISRVSNFEDYLIGGNVKSAHFCPAIEGLKRRSGARAYGRSARSGLKRLRLWGAVRRGNPEFHGKRDDRGGRSTVDAGVASGSSELLLSSDGAARARPVRQQLHDEPSQRQPAGTSRKRSGSPLALSVQKSVKAARREANILTNVGRSQHEATDPEGWGPAMNALPAEERARLKKS
eukprot:1440139-Karenia_brevis.AAC.1